MSMSEDTKKGKIFSEEDFDKPSPKGNWFFGHLKHIVGGVLVLAAIILAIVFVPRKCTKGKTPDTLITDTIANGLNSETNVEDSITVNPVSDVENSSTEKADNYSSTNIDNAQTDTNPSEPTNISVSTDVVKEALSVIRGNYGNNPDRRRLLKERYQEIQNKVNEMYRNGQVK